MENEQTHSSGDRALQSLEVDKEDLGTPSKKQTIKKTASLDKYFRGLAAPLCK